MENICITMLNTANAMIENSMTLNAYLHLTHNPIHLRMRHSTGFCNIAKNIPNLDWRRVASLMMYSNVHKNSMAHKTINSFEIWVHHQLEESHCHDITYTIIHQVWWQINALCAASAKTLANQKTDTLFRFWYISNKPLIKSLYGSMSLACQQMMQRHRNIASIHTFGFFYTCYERGTKNA